MTTSPSDDGKKPSVGTPAGQDGTKRRHKKKKKIQKKKKNSRNGNTRHNGNPEKSESTFSYNLTTNFIIH